METVVYQSESVGIHGFSLTPLTTRMPLGTPQQHRRPRAFSTGSMPEILRMHITSRKNPSRSLSKTGVSSPTIEKASLPNRMQPGCNVASLASGNNEKGNFSNRVPHVQPRGNEYYDYCFSCNIDPPGSMFEKNKCTSSLELTASTRRRMLVHASSFVKPSLNVLSTPICGTRGHLRELRRMSLPTDLEESVAAATLGTGLLRNGTLCKGQGRHGTLYHGRDGTLCNRRVGTGGGGIRDTSGHLRGSLHHVDSITSLRRKSRRQERDGDCNFGSAASFDDDDEDYSFWAERINGSCCVLQVSSSSSMEVPALRLLVCAAEGQLRTRFIECVLALGEPGDEDDILEESEYPSQRGTYICLGDDEYFLTLAQSSTAEKLPSMHDVDALLLLFTHSNFASLTACQNCLKQGQLSESTKPPGGVYLVGLGSSLEEDTDDTADLMKDCKEALRIAEEEDCIYLPLGSLFPTVVCSFVRDLVSAVEKRRACVSDDADVINGCAAGIGADNNSFFNEHTKNGLRGQGSGGVDKTMLFNRFFWGDMTTKSCDNLMAL